MSRAAVDPARSAAAAAVEAALAGRTFATDAIRAQRAAGILGKRDAALALEIAQGAIRHYLLLRQVLSRVGKHRLFASRRLRAILLSGAYQAIWMDRVPAFAAVSRTVELAKRAEGARAAGFANALLRRLLAAVAAQRTEWIRLDRRQIRVDWSRACALHCDLHPPPALAEAHAACLASAAGETLERYLALARRFGAGAAEQIAWACQAVPPLVIHRSPLHGAAESAADLAALPGVEWNGDVGFAPAGAGIIDTAAFREGRIYVEDQTAHAAALAVAAQPGERILDACAAPGGKSVALGMRMRGAGEIVACDVSAARLERVRENAQRMRLGLIRTVETDARRPPDDLGPFDAALADVPCSNSGVIARRPEARFRLKPETLRSLAEMQKQVLHGAARAVRSGGRLVYSTCSIEDEENERVVQWFLRQASGWTLEAQQLTLPRWGPRLSDWQDGGFWARLRRA